jgi:hypothetical protein
MIRIKNWEKFNKKPFRLVDDSIKTGDNFIFNDDGIIRKCISHVNRIGTFSEIINGTFSEKLCKKIVFDDSIKMEFEDIILPEKKLTPPNLKKGDICFYLDEYVLSKGIVESIGPKNIKIKTQNYNNIFFITKSFDKVAEPDEKIAVIWERWKGVNGRGGYRLERNLYPNLLKPAKLWPYQSYIDEYKYGKLKN